MTTYETSSGLRKTANSLTSSQLEGFGERYRDSNDRENKKGHKQLHSSRAVDIDHGKNLVPTSRLKRADRHQSSVTPEAQQRALLK